MTSWKMSETQQGIVLRNVRSNLGVYIERLRNLPHSPHIDQAINHMYEAIDEIDLTADSREIVLAAKMPT
ncbi:hypothetical protein FHT44_004918 [Mycolicibacterium sp. BK634]|uniref:hypothetical protein n=1 Tax=Mycolicibacterium sp. BK634 TaxID=2587099 RepID=UPI00161A0BAA|nr:hypothetical protein [Mycolicibacterium sp. BK634]MBB3752406.1 hypothetical protein [Mycolicibacterium sp. BK634]